MHGRVPRGDEMLRDAHTGAAKRRWSGRTVQAWSSAARRARDALSAGDVSVRTAARDAAAAGLTHPYASSSALEDIFAALHAHPIEGLEGLVVGSETPWIEAILLGFGAARVTTAEYRAIALEQDDDPRRAAHPLRLDVMRPAALWRRLAREGGQHARFDFVFAFSSIEHDGLARFGDAVAPDADLETMARLRCALRPNGRAFIAVPTGPDFLQWNAHRIYGALRLPLLLRGWRLRGSYGTAVIGTQYFSDVFRRLRLQQPRYTQPVLVLEPRSYSAAQASSSMD